MSRRLWVFLILASSATAQKTTPSPSPLPPGNAFVPLFQVEKPDPSEGVKDGEVTINPILLLNGKQIVAVPYDCDSRAEIAKQAKSFDDRYLKPGTRFTVIFGGEEAGTATIKSVDPDLPFTAVELDSPVRIHGATMVLALPPGIFPRKRSLRRDPTISERARAEQIARTSSPLRELNSQT
jgi:hypothetical protein